MQIIDIKFYDGIHLGQFTIFVLGQEVYRTWVKNAYLFNYKNGNVYFSAGGVEDRFAGKANDREEIIKVAIEYLESWLIACSAIGKIERKEHPVKIEEEDGKEIFTIQVWALEKETKQWNYRPFRFKYQNRQVYYLGNDKEEKNDLVRFYYKSKDVNKKTYTIKTELKISPSNKKEAIRDAIDYLEWLSDIDKDGVYTLY